MRRNRNMVLAAETAASKWSMSMTSLLTALPNSPSPICSRASSVPHPTPPHYFHSQQQEDYATEFSSPRNQSFGIACNDDNYNCFSDIDEWLEHANKFCKPSDSNTDHLSETVGLRQDAGLEDDDDLRISAICSTFLKAHELDLYGITLPSIREESRVFQGQISGLSSMYGPRNNEQMRRLLSRPKPYDEFFSDATGKKHQVQMEASNKAKQVELMHRMKSKEDAIDNWELQKTREAMDQMDKIQNALERKQLRASARTQKKICSVREKAEKQKLDLRRSTMKRFQQLQKSETISSTANYWSSRLPLC